MTFQNPDETWIRVEVPELIDAEDFVAEVRAALPPEVFIAFDDGVERWERIERLASERLVGRSSMWLDLERLPARLENAEEPIELARATYGDSEGLLVLTDRRVVWVRHAREGQEDGFVALARTDVAEAKSSPSVSGSGVGARSWPSGSR